VTGLSLYDLLGVADAAAAATLWPGDRFTMVEGFNTVDDATACVEALQDAVSFTRIRVGSDPTVRLGDATSPGKGAPGQVTLAADATVVGNVGPFYARDLPNVGIVLLATKAGKPATVFAAYDGRGTEVLVEGLPVELQLPRGLITPAKDSDDVVGSAADFDAGAEDSVAVVVARADPTAIRCQVRLHLTPDGDVLLEPNTPLSFDAARMFDVPFTALHDLLVIPSPRRRDRFEWARNDLTPIFGGLGLPPGAIGFRSILLDLARPPFADLVKRFRDHTSPLSEPVELVLEDVVLPVTGTGLPIPSHGSFGIRRKIVDRNSIEQAYSLANAPFRTRLYSRDGAADSGAGLYLVVERLEFRTGSTASHSDSPPVLELTAGLVWQGSGSSQTGGTLAIGDDWLLQLSVELGAVSPLHVGTFVGAVVSINAIRLGLRLTTLDDAGNSWQVLVDVSVRDTSAPPADGKSSPFKVTSLTGKPLDVILRDIGWSLGRPQLGTSIAAPEGVQLVFAGVVRLILEELGFVEEPGGGTYFSFSGGVAIGSASGNEQQPTSARDAHAGNSAGIRFRRLRFLTSGTPSAPPVKLDGIFLNLHYGSVTIAGFGYITDDTAGGYRYQEWGFGIKLEFPLLGVQLSIAAEFLKGTKTAVADPDDRFTYLLASLQIGYIPVASVGLYAVRLLFAYNMQPALDPPGADGEGMVLYQWHKDHDGAIDMPRTRNLADWTPVNHSLAAGVGLGFSLNSAGAIFHIGAFVMVTRSEADALVLVVGELYLVKNPQPIAFVAIEYDVAREKFGIMAGVDMTLAKFVGGDTVPGWISALARLSGTIYFGNKPWSLAIGQLADQRTWLGIKAHVEFLDLDLRLAIGLQVTEGGPKGFGAVFSFSGGADWGIGRFVVFGGLGFIVGTWKTGSDSSGTHAWAQLGFKINVFYVFSFGADIGVDVTHLGKHPWYTTLKGQIHINTPWFLPDVTFEFSRTWHESMPFDTASTTQALHSGLASSPTAPGSDNAVPLHVPALSDGNTDPSRLYTFNELATVHGAPVTGAALPADLVPVAVDAEVSLTFVNPLANDALIATDSYTGTGDLGTQKVQDLTVRYALKRVTIQRRPRFGSGSATWTDLVAAADTELDLSGGGAVHLAPAVSFRWDTDSRADGVLAPNRLLINCRTPYSLVVGSPQDDEDALAKDDGFPCCRPDGKGRQPTWHVLSWSSRGPGLRLPPTEQFSHDGGRWRWIERPVTIAGVGAFAGQVVALALPRVNPLLGSVELDSPALTFIAQVSPLNATCVVEAYHGLTLVDSRSVPVGAPPTPVQLSGTVTKPITRVAVKVAASGFGTHGSESPFGPPGTVAVQLADLRYAELADLLRVAAHELRCQRGGTSTAVGGGGKLAFLPNHDYAVTATVEVAVGHTTGGRRTLTLSEPAFFRTKGLLGLNAVPNVGDELRPYVAASYPPHRGVPLYRSEPVALAFTEDISNLLPVDRVPAAGDPPEKAQLMELVLSVEQVSSTDGAVRLTATSPDWITAHGGTGGDPARPPFRTDAYAASVVRRAPSLDARVRRFEAVLDAAGCAHDPLHSSQVLLHRPVGADGTAGAWQGQAGMRATVRARNGPFTQRDSFRAADLAALTYLSDSPNATAWTLHDGALVAPGGGRRYAAFGDSTWNHLQIHTTVDPAGALAGLAIGVSGTSPVAQAILALVDHDRLVLVRRIGGTGQELARTPLPPLDGPVELHVTAFDDVVWASVGDAVVEGPRDAVREGRVALVGDGNAVFSRLLVDSLDMYAVEFATSRYLSFADHVAGRDPVVHAQDASAMGAAPATTPGQFVSTRAADVAGAMSAGADPQRRHRLFGELLSGVGLALLQRCDQLTVTRLTDASGTTALLLESPEPISVLHDVAVRLLRRTWRFVPPWHRPDGSDAADVRQALSLLQTRDGELLVPPRAGRVLGTGPGRVVVIRSQDPVTVDVYALVAKGSAVTSAQRVSTLDGPAAERAGLGELLRYPAGALAAIGPGGSIAGVAMAPWVDGSVLHVDLPVPTTVLTDGDERRMICVPVAPLHAGTHLLNLTFSRRRWESTTPNPDAQYTDAATVELTW
jgi:hypothetical protein